MRSSGLRVSLLELNDDLGGCYIHDVDICMFKYIDMKCLIYGKSMLLI